MARVVEPSQGAISVGAADKLDASIAGHAPRDWLGASRTCQAGEGASLCRCGGRRPGTRRAIRQTSRGCSARMFSSRRPLISQTLSDKRSPDCLYHADAAIDRVSQWLVRSSTPMRDTACARPGMRRNPQRRQLPRTLPGGIGDLFAARDDGTSASVDWLTTCVIPVNQETDMDHDTSSLRRRHVAGSPGAHRQAPSTLHECGPPVGIALSWKGGS
jgi:hypothetical protein